MFIFTAKFSKKKAVLAVLILGIALCCAVLVIGAISRDGDGSPEASPYDVSDNDSRVAYLESLGWKIDTDPVETLELMLPETLDESYAEYNSLQKDQGFDLENACGKRVKRYTYSVTNYPGITSGVQADIYICDSTVIAGDILASGENGFIAALTYPE